MDNVIENNSDKLKPSMGTNSRKLKPPSSSSSYYLPRCIPLLLFLAVFALLFFFNIDTFVSRTKLLPSTPSPNNHASS